MSRKSLAIDSRKLPLAVNFLLYIFHEGDANFTLVLLFIWRLMSRKLTSISSEKRLRKMSP